MDIYCRQTQLYEMHDKGSQRVKVYEEPFSGLEPEPKSEDGPANTDGTVSETIKSLQN